MTSAILALEDGTLFYGSSIGAEGSSVGEVVFNTAMTGYQEILTDPSYARQLVTLTYPHIGNTGCNSVDVESARPMAGGLIVRDYSRTYSNWRAEESLEAYLVRNDLVGIADIDTRKLTRILRTKGAQNGCLIAGENPDPQEAIKQAQAFPGLKGMDLAKEVTTDDIHEWDGGGVYDLDAQQFRTTGESMHVVAYDFGCKYNILRLLSEQGCRITVVPAETPASKVLEMKPDGVFLSNGPGDPQPCTYAIEAIAEILARRIPIFGICLGHQLLGLAAGAQSMKMKFGHHGANHPVEDLATGQVLITSQNHGFAIDESSLQDNVKPTHRSLFDGSLQGIELTDAPAFGFQGHPEASPGPHDIQPLFERFVKQMKEASERAA